MLEPETIWESLLSRDPHQILETWQLLNPEERMSVREHLERMVTDDGWAPSQRESAQAALDALGQEAQR